MQVVILFYHLTGASRLIPIYMCIRVLVSAYLFMSGFGHFSYYWLTGDTSLARFVRVQFRLNLLVFVLCLVMHRHYQFYYFVPLVSFWFTVVHVTMALPPHVTRASAQASPYRLLLVVGKFVALGAAVAMLSMSQVLFNWIFLAWPWRALFVNTQGEVGAASDDLAAHEWFFRWHLDRFTVLGGMVSTIFRNSRFNLLIN